MTFSPRTTIAMFLLAGTSLCTSAPLPANAVQQTTAPLGAGVSIGFGVEPASNYYDFDGSALSWREKTEADISYLYAVVVSTGTQEILPGCKVTALIKEADGKAVGSTVTLEETWDPRFRHYGANLHLPASLSTGSIEIFVEPFTGRRRGFNQGNFFTRPVSVSFENANLRPNGAATATSAKGTTNGAPERVDWPEGRRPYIEPTPYPGSPAAK